MKIPSETDIRRGNERKTDNNSFVTPDLSVCSSSSNPNTYTTPTSPIITPKIPIKSISHAPKTPSQPNNIKRPNIQQHNSTPSPPQQQQKQQYIRQSPPPHHYSPPQLSSNHSSGRTSPIYSPKHVVSSFKKNEDGITIMADNFSPLSQSGGLSVSLLSDSFENDMFGSSGDNTEKNFYYVSPCRSLDSSASDFSQ